MQKSILSLAVLVRRAHLRRNLGLLCLRAGRLGNWRGARSRR